MKYLLEILKIVDGAVGFDRNKVTAYTEQLADKAEKEGDSRSANRLRKALKKSNSELMNLANMAKNGRIPVDTESRLSLADEEIVHPSEAEIFLEDESHETVAEFLRYVGAADHLLAAGVGISPSLLIYGPPGCGKTELARYISSQFKLPLLTARTDSLISSYLGNTAKNLRMLFEHSMARPCVLFLDEFDAVGKLRDDIHELGELKRVVVSLLQNIDALDNKTILIAATNHEHLLDPAIWRRFTYQVQMNLPDLNIRVQLFNKYLNSFSNIKSNKLYASVSEGLSGSDIRMIGENAIRDSVLNGEKYIKNKDVLKRVLKVQFSNKEKSTVTFNDQIIRARDFNPKAFTIRRLSDIFGISTGKISALLNTSRED